MYVKYITFLVYVLNTSELNVKCQWDLIFSLTPTYEFTKKTNELLPFENPM